MSQPHRSQSGMEAVGTETVVALGYPANAAPGDAVTSTRGVVSATSTAFRDPSPDVPAYQDAIRQCSHWRKVMATPASRPRNPPAIPSR